QERRGRRDVEELQSQRLVRGRLADRLGLAPDQIDPAGRLQHVPGIEVERPELVHREAEAIVQLEAANDRAEVGGVIALAGIDDAVDDELRRLATRTVLDQAADGRHLDATAPALPVDEYRTGEVPGRQRQVLEVHRAVAQVDANVVAEV